MKILLASILLSAPLVALAQGYQCFFNGTFRSEPVGGSLDLSFGEEPVEIVRTIAGQNHFYEFTVYEHEELPYFQLLEGKILDGDVYVNTNSFTLDLLPRQRSFGASFDLCTQDTTCWTLRCELAENR